MHIHETAAGGRWCTGPGLDLFDAVRDALGELPVVAEDLGLITDDVRQLRRDLGLPGMRVLQFGLEEGGGEHLPGAWEPNLVAYTATHDSDTSLGWYVGLEREVRRRVRRALGPEPEVNWAMLRAVMNSAADTAVMPLQDLLGLGSEARFNTPGTAQGNWGWRFEWPRLTARLAGRLRRLTESTRRVPGVTAVAPHG